MSISWLDTLGLRLFGLVVLVGAISGYATGDAGGLFVGLIVGFASGVIIFAVLFLLLEMNDHLRVIRNQLANGGAPAGRFGADGNVNKRTADRLVEAPEHPFEAVSVDPLGALEKRVPGIQQLVQLRTGQVGVGFPLRALQPYRKTPGGRSSSGRSSRALNRSCTILPQPGASRAFKSLGVCQARLLKMASKTVTACPETRTLFVKTSQRSIPPRRDACRASRRVVPSTDAQ